MIIRTLRLFTFFAIPVLVASCDASGDNNQAAYPPPAVKTMTLKGEDIALRKEYPGRLVAIRLAEVRARVSGIVLARTFAEGKDVKAGEILFQIDPAKFQASVDAAQAQLEQADASLVLAAQQEARSEELFAKSIVSKNQYDIAVSTRRQAEAAVAVAKANLQAAQLDLSYASVRSPIDGRIGAALVTEGAFVREEDATQMATVRDLSSLYVDFTAPLADLNRSQKELGPGAQDGASEADEVQLLNSDGEAFGQPGKLLFSSAVVDETTGQVSLRAEFSNPGRKLLPGTYVRVSLVQGVSKNALLIPQRAVQWDTLGQARVMTVEDGKAIVRPVTTSRSIGNRWMIVNGLKAGDQVIVDGADKAMPGGPVTAQAAPEAAGPSNVGARSECAQPCDQQAKL